MTPVQTLYRWFNDNPEATYKEALEAYEHCLELEKKEQEKLVNDALINYGIGYSSPKVENKTSFGEISDEEIWEASINYDNGATYETPIVHFQQGAFWYREQLKSRRIN